MQKRIKMLMGGIGFCIILVIWLLSRGTANAKKSACSMGLENPFEPGSLDIVINYVNFTDPKKPLPEAQAQECGACGRKECDAFSDAPCCQNWHSPDHALGTCGSGPAFCECANCLDSRVVGSDRSYSELRWTLRGIDHNIGVWSQANPSNLVRHIYIIYNTIEGNGPPNFIEWEPCSYRNELRSAECNETVYVSTRDSSLVAIPQCFYFPPGSPLHGQTRDASQIPVHRIANLSKWFLYFEDDMIPSAQFRPSDFVDFTTKKMKSYSDAFYLFDYFQPGHWAGAKLYTQGLLAKKFGWRLRFGEGSHVPLFISRCAMEEVERTWNEDFLFTVKDHEGSKHLQFPTMASNYPIDAGLADNHIFSSHVNFQVHLDLEGKHADLRSWFCDWIESPTPFIQLQGPSWSDEMTICGPPRADWRREIDSFLHYLLPVPSRFEDPVEAQLFNSRPRASLSWPCPPRHKSMFRFLPALIVTGICAWLVWYRKVSRLARARDD